MGMAMNVAVKLDEYEEEYGCESRDAEDVGAYRTDAASQEERLNDVRHSSRPDVTSFETPYANKGPSNNKELGVFGEYAACEILKMKDYIILERNWHCISGEADIIAIDGDCLVFVEVKTRKGTGKGFPEEAVTARKRTKYERIAECYLNEYDGANARIRFDVMSIILLASGRAYAKHIINAFGQGE